MTSLEEDIKKAELQFITCDYLKDGTTKLPYHKSSKLYQRAVTAQGSEIKALERYFIKLLNDDVLVHINQSRCENVRLRLGLLKVQQLLTEAECGSSS